MKCPFTLDNCFSDAQDDCQSCPDYREYKQPKPDYDFSSFDVIQRLAKDPDYRPEPTMDEDLSIDVKCEVKP